MFEPDSRGLRLGPLWFNPGLSGLNVGAVVLAAFITIPLVAFMSFVQPYVLNEIVQVPVERQGTLTGNLAAMQEALSIVLTGLFGAWSDRVGRRFVFIIGFLLMALSYSIYPLANSESQLVVYRLLFAVGGTAVPLMYSASLHDACQETSRGKWVAFNSIFSGVGIILMALVLAKMPQWYQSLGANAVDAGRYAFWTVALVCVLAGVVLWLMLDPRIHGKAGERNIFRRVGDGIRAGIENPRLAIAYAGAFIGRGDLVIITTFVSLWVVQTGIEQGMSTGQSLAKAGVLFGIVQAAALLWTLVMGTISDRLNRMTALCVALLLATLGYSLMGQVRDPFGIAVYPAAILLGIGEVSVLVAAGALVGQESRPATRGAVIGIFGVAGSAGILFAAFFGGLAFDHIGRTAPFTMMGLLNFLLLAAAFVVRRKPG